MRWFGTKPSRMLILTRHARRTPAGFFFGFRTLPLILVNAIGFALSIVTALLSWNLLEKHFLKLKALPLFYQGRIAPGSMFTRRPENASLIQ